MKKILIAGFIALAGISVKAQDFDLSWGPVAKASSSDAAYYSLGWHEGKYYTIKFDNGNGYLMSANDKLEITGQPELITGQKKFSAQFANIEGDKLLTLDYEYEKDVKATLVKAWRFTLDGKPSSIKDKTVVKFPVEKAKEAEDVTFHYSPDKSKILCVMEHDLSPKENSVVSFAVINASDLDMVWKTDATIPYLDNDFTMLSFAVDNSGNVVALGLVENEEGKHLEKYSMRMFSFNTASEKFDDRELKIDGKFISSAFIDFTTNQSLMISGFYNELNSKGKSEGIEGAFLATAELNNLQNLDMRTAEISPSTKAAITPTSGFAKWIGADELNAYEIRKINLRPDGSGYVIAEQRFVQRDLDANGDRRTYFFNHIIAYGFDADKNIIWLSSVPKLQESTVVAPVLNIGPVAVSMWSSVHSRLAYKYNSFQQVEINGKIYLLYNDHRDNGDAVSLKETKTMSNKKNANGVVVTIDANTGKWEKTTLFSGKEVDVILESSSCFPIPGEGFTISAEKGKDLQLGTLKLN